MRHAHPMTSWPYIEAPVERVVRAASLRVMAPAAGHGEGTYGYGASRRRNPTCARYGTYLKPGNACPRRFPGLVQAKERRLVLTLPGVSLFALFYLLDVFSGGTGSTLPKGIDAALHASSMLDCVAAVVDTAREIDGLPSVAQVTFIVRGVFVRVTHNRG